MDLAKRGAVERRTVNGRRNTLGLDSLILRDRNLWRHLPFWGWVVPGRTGDSGTDMRLIIDPVPQYLPFNGRLSGTSETFVRTHLFSAAKSKELKMGMPCSRLERFERASDSAGVATRRFVSLLYGVNSVSCKSGLPVIAVVDWTICVLENR
jgi:hypothetical protein